MISAPTTSAFVAHLAPERVRGRYMGALSLAWNASAIAGPQLGFRLFALDPRFVWFGSAALGLTAATITVLLGKTRHRDESAPRVVTGPEIASQEPPRSDRAPGRPAHRAIS